MQRLDVLERAFPGARYLHLVRDGRDAALSFLALTRRARFNPARPRSVGSFASSGGARSRGRGASAAIASAGRYREIRYEDLVTRAGAERCAEACAFLGLEFDPAMLAYHREAGRGNPPRPSAARRAPRPGPRGSWRDQMAPGEVEMFEAIAGELLAEFGYERAHPQPSAGARARGAAPATPRSPSGTARVLREPCGACAGLRPPKPEAGASRQVLHPADASRSGTSPPEPPRPLADRVAELAQALARDRLEIGDVLGGSSARASGRSASGPGGRLRFSMIFMRSSVETMRPSGATSSGGVSSAIRSSTFS